MTGCWFASHVGVRPVPAPGGRPAPAPVLAPWAAAPVPLAAAQLQDAQRLQVDAGIIIGRRHFQGWLFVGATGPRAGPDATSGSLQAS